MFSQEVIWQADLALVGVMTLVGLGAMGLDKTIARKNGERVQRGKKPRRRIPEKTLFLIAALGGSLGVLAGMYLFRHKTKHKSFVFGVPLILAAQIALAWLLVTKLG